MPSPISIRRSRSTATIRRRITSAPPRCSEKHNFDRAIADFNVAINVRPDYTEAFNARALAYAGKGDIDRAILDYNQAIRLDPEISAGADQPRQCSPRAL